MDCERRLASSNCIAVSADGELGADDRSSMPAPQHHTSARDGSYGKFWPAAARCSVSWGAHEKSNFSQQSRSKQRQKQVQSPIWAEVRTEADFHEGRDAVHAAGSKIQWQFPIQFRSRSKSNSVAVSAWVEARTVADFHQRRYAVDTAACLDRLCRWLDWQVRVHALACM